MQFWKLWIINVVYYFCLYYQKIKKSDLALPQIYTSNAKKNVITWLDFFYFHMKSNHWLLNDNFPNKQNKFWMVYFMYLLVSI